MVKTRFAALKERYDDSFWKAAETEALVDFLFNVSTRRKRELHKLKVLPYQCKRGAKGLRLLFGKVTNKHLVFIKVSQLKERFMKFEKFLTVPGVSFNPTTNKVIVRRDVYPFKNEVEPPLWKYFTVTGMNQYAKLQYLMCEVNLPCFPYNMLGSRSDPISLDGEGDDPRESCGSCATP